MFVLEWFGVSVIFKKWYSYPPSGGKFLGNWMIIHKGNHHSEAKIAPGGACGGPKIFAFSITLNSSPCTIILANPLLKKIIGTLVNSKLMDLAVANNKSWSASNQIRFENSLRLILLVANHCGVRLRNTSWHHAAQWHWNVWLRRSWQTPSYTEGISEEWCVAIWIPLGVCTSTNVYRARTVWRWPSLKNRNV